MYIVVVVKEMADVLGAVVSGVQELRTWRELVSNICSSSSRQETYHSIRELSTWRLYS